MIKLEFNELEIKPDDLFKPEMYEPNSLNLVNDGIAFHLVSVLGNMVQAIPLQNVDIFKQKIDDSTKCARESYAQDVDRKLKYITEQLNKLEDKPSNDTFGLDAITKLVAVSQKPEMLKES